MLKCRILFTKTGRGKYISHLDMMHTMQRVFVRAGVPIVHTQGFNPHPYMVFALPLSVGTESVCELLDIELEDLRIPMEKIPYVLNSASPDGIEFITAYEPEKKFKDITYLAVSGKFEYDSGLSGVCEKLSEFFGREEIVIKKRTKKGISDTDIIPGIKSVEFTEKDGYVSVSAVLTAQNPTTNPELLVSALRELAPDIAPDFSEFMRIKMLCSDLSEFR